MPLGTHAASLAVQSRPVSPALVIPDDRRALRGKTVPLHHQEPVSRDRQRGVMVKPAPVSPLVMPQPQLLLQFLVVSFDDPALLGHFDQVRQLGFLRQGRDPVFRRFRLAARPLPFRRLAGKGCLPGSQTLVDDSTPVMYCSPAPSLGILGTRGNETFAWTENYA